MMYEYGSGVEQDEEEAFRLYKKVAEQDLSWGQYKVGEMLLLSDVIENDPDEAYKWLKLSADNYDDRAPFLLGRMCEDGVGVRQDIDEAINWFKKAAELDNEDAKKKLREYGIKKLINYYK